MKKRRYNAKASFSALEGAATYVGLGVAAVVGTGVFLWASGAFAAPVNEQPTPGESPCGSAALQRAIAGAAAGGATGAAAGPYGAGAGAGIAIAPGLLQCGPDKFNKAKKFLCANADKVVAKLKAKGAKIPKQWKKFSCDEKIAWVAALGPTGITMVLAGALLGKFSTDAVNETKRFAEFAAKTAGKYGNAAKDAAKDFGGSVSDAGKSVAKSIGIGNIEGVHGPFRPLGQLHAAGARFGFAGRTTEEVLVSPRSNALSMTLTRPNSIIANAWRFKGGR